MAKVIPFKGLRYSIDIVGDISNITIPPYDIISKEEQEAFYNKNSYNSIRLELPLELPEDDESNNKYKRAGDTLQSWIDEKVLYHEEKESLYIYQQEFESGGQVYIRTGLIGLVELEDFEKEIILPHENTLSKPKADRLQLMRSCNANFSQVFGLYDDKKQNILGLIKGYCKEHEPDLVTDKGIVNNIERIWAVNDEDFINEVRKGIEDKQLYIADGHHRYETALAYRDELKENNPNHTGNELYNYVMMTIVEMEDPGLIILPTHRMVHKIHGFNLPDFLHKAKEDFVVEEHNVKDYDVKVKSQKIEELLQDKGIHSFVVYGSNKDTLYSLSLKSIDTMKDFHSMRDISYIDLDVSILHTLLLEKLLGIGEKQLANQEHLEYTHSIEEGVEEVDKAKQQITLFTSPTSIRQIQKVSLANEKMPQKSTYFYPKLLTGLVFNKL